MKNSKGEIYYGMHFYPGVAQYDEPDGSSFRIFINEDTIRKMDASFAGRPIFVEHVEGVDDDLDTLKNEADGWVSESFFNEKDGKHWVKFIVCSERGLRAVRRGWKLSNAYIPQTVMKSGEWSGVSYQKVVVNGEFEHLAIVSNPRYDESVIMTPEEFKTYNEDKGEELKRIANSKGKQGDKIMGLNIFKRQKVDNSVDFESMVVELPKSKKEITLAKLVNDHDAIINMNGYANDEHMVKLNDKEEMSVKDLVKAHQAKCNEIEEMKKKNADTEMGGEPGMDDMDMDDPAMDNDSEAEIEESQTKDVGSRGGDKSLDNEDDEDEKKKEKMKNDLDMARKLLARHKAASLKNANLRNRDEETVSIDLPQDKVARGKARYGSGN